MTIDAPLNVFRIDVWIIGLNLNVVFNGTTGTFYIHFPIFGIPICAIEKYNVGKFKLTKYISAANNISSVP